MCRWHNAGSCRQATSKPRGFPSPAAARSERDTGRTAAVAIVNGRWPGSGSAGSSRLARSSSTTRRPAAPIEIVGVVGNVQMALDAEPMWDLYLAYPQVHPDNAGAAAANMFWLVRTSGEPINLAARFARALRRIDPAAAAAQIRPLEDYPTDAVPPPRSSLSLLTAFAMPAPAPPIPGIHAVVACSIGQRTRTRHPGRARRQPGEHPAGRDQPTVRCITIGLGAGVAMAIAATRLLSGMSSVSRRPMPRHLADAAVIAAVSILACAVPAARTGRETNCAPQTGLMSREPQLLADCPLAVTAIQRETIVSLMWDSGCSGTNSRPVEGLVACRR